MSGMSMEWEGLGEVTQKLEQMPNRMIQPLEAALFQEGEELMAASKPLVPVDTGALRSSGFVSLPELDDAGQLFVKVGFGGPAGSGVEEPSSSESDNRRQHKSQNKTDVGYAVYVHENMEAHHIVGQAKYLEQPFNERKQGITDRLVERCRGKF